MALRNIQVSKALVVAVKRSQSQIWDLKFAYAWQLIKYFCGLLHEVVVKPEWLVKINVSKFQ